MGQSEVGPRNLTPLKEIEQLDDALDKLGAHRLVLVGHSYGGLLSLYHAAHRPERVAGLVLVDPMNPIFVDNVTLAWLNTTVPDLPDPKTPQEITTSRIKQTMPDLVGAARAAPTSIKVPIVVVTAGIPWLGKPPIDSAWRQSHEALVARGKPRELVVATKSQHGIPATEPDLIVGAVERVLALIEAARKR
jgi:pimeloyl-ACP methyl ester carboxylesterase